MELCVTYDLPNVEAISYDFKMSIVNDIYLWSLMIREGPLARGMG